MDNTAARAIHVRQIINWLRGVPANSEPVNFTGITNRLSYALTVRNNDPTNDALYGKAFSVENSAGTRKLLDVGNYGVIMRPNVDGGVILSIRNFADTADVFTVTTAGATLGTSGDVVTTGATQTLLAKTLTTPVINGARVGTYLDVTQQAAAPANPTAGNFRLYALTGSNLVAVRDSLGVERVLVDADSLQTLTNKTINSATLGSDIHSTFMELMGQAAAPATGGAGRTRLFALTSDGVLRGVNAAGVSEVYVARDRIETLLNKTLTSPVLNTPTVNSPTFTESLLFGDRVAVAPTIGVTGAAIYKNAADASLKFKSGNDTERTVVDTASAQTLSNKTMSAPVQTTPTVNEYITLNDRTVAAPVIGATAAAIYKTATDASLKFKSGTNTEHTIVDTDSTQTLVGKTLTGPAVSAPIISDYINLSDRVTVLGNPGISNSFLFKSPGETFLRYRAGNATDRVLVDTDSTQTLSNKTLLALTVTGAVFNNPTISNYEDYQQQAATPGSSPAVGYSRIYLSTANSIKLKDSGGVEQTVLTTTNSALVSAVGWVRPLMLGVL